jgi:hypothetical protein
MCKVEDILYKAYEKGIHKQVLEMVNKIKHRYPYHEYKDVLEIAYQQVKQTSYK